MNEQTWNSVRGKLETSLGRNAFQSWIDPLVFERYDGDVLSLSAPTPFIGDWVSRHYSEDIRSHLV